MRLSAEKHPSRRRVNPQEKIKLWATAPRKLTRKNPARNRPKSTRPARKKLPPSQPSLRPARRGNLPPVSPGKWFRRDGFCGGHFLVPRPLFFQRNLESLCSSEPATNLICHSASLSPSSFGLVCRSSGSPARAGRGGGNRSAAILRTAGVFDYVRRPAAARE